MTPTLTAHPGSSLRVSERIEERLNTGELTLAQVEDFREFLAAVDRDLLQHRIITKNEYTRWFQKGNVSDAELKHFVKQFSVFSNLFLVAALLKVINRSEPAGRAGQQGNPDERAGRYLPQEGASDRRPGVQSDDDKDREGDPDLVSIEGTVDGGICRFQAAHFEWLLKVGEGLGLGFKDLGKRRLGRPGTLKFCDELARLYGSDDPQIAEGASFAVENWAAAGFWQELEDGLMLLKKTRYPHLKLAFFTWHNRVEAQHACHTMEELEEVYFSPEFNRAKFFQGGREILEGVAAFWEGSMRIA